MVNVNLPIKSTHKHIKYSQMFSCFSQSCSSFSLGRRAFRVRLDHHILLFSKNKSCTCQQIRKFILNFCKVIQNENNSSFLFGNFAVNCSFDQIGCVRIPRMLSGVCEVELKSLNRFCSFPLKVKHLNATCAILQRILNVPRKWSHWVQP